MTRTGHALMPSFTPTSIHEQIVRHLTLSILRDDIRPGDQLPSEPELCSQLAISRPILREAIKVLAAKGLVESRPRTGTRVRPRTAWNHLDPDILAWRCEVPRNESFMLNLYEVRWLLEADAARLAAQRGSECDITILRERYQAMRQTCNVMTDFIQADRAFHDALLLASHNELLQHMVEAVYTALHLAYLTTRQRPIYADMYLPLHEDLTIAIGTHDEQRAWSTMLKLAEHIHIAPPTPPTVPDATEEAVF